MSKRQEPTSQSEGLWVRSELLPDGSYGIGLSLDADKAWAFNEADAVLYAHSLLREVAFSLYDAAVVAQVQRKMNLGPKEAAQMVCDLRELRGPSAWPGDLSYVGGVNMRGRAFLTACWKGEPEFQLDPGPAREHAVAVLEVVTTSGLDNTYKKVLMEKVGIEDWRASNVVDDLLHWRRR